MFQDCKLCKTGINYVEVICQKLCIKYSNNIAVHSFHIVPTLALWFLNYVWLINYGGGGGYFLYNMVQWKKYGRAHKGK